MEFECVGHGLGGVPDASYQSAPNTMINPS